MTEDDTFKALKQIPYKELVDGWLIEYELNWKHLQIYGSLGTEFIHYLNKNGWEYEDFLIARNLPKNKQ